MFSLFYVTGEFNKFLHRGWAAIGKKRLAEGTVELLSINKKRITINNGEQVKCYVNSKVYKILKTTYEEKLWTCNPTIK